MNDSKRIEEVLDSIVIRRDDPPSRRNKHLCADAGYRDAASLPIPAKVATIPGHGCHPTVLNRPQVGL